MATDDPRRRVASSGDLRSRLPTTALGLAMLLFCMSIGVGLHRRGALRLLRVPARARPRTRSTPSRRASARRVDDAVDQHRRGARRRRRPGADPARRPREVRGQRRDAQRPARAGPALGVVRADARRGRASRRWARRSWCSPTTSSRSCSPPTRRCGPPPPKPAPDITLRKGDEELTATLTSWDPPQRPRAAHRRQARTCPRSTWAPTDPPVQVGDRVFVVSGLGAAGGSISQGFVAGVSAEGIQHDAPVGRRLPGRPAAQLRRRGARRWPAGPTRRSGSRPRRCSSASRSAPRAPRSSAAPTGRPSPASRGQLEPPEDAAGRPVVGGGRARSARRSWSGSSGVGRAAAPRRRARRRPRSLGQLAGARARSRRAGGAWPRRAPRGSAPAR